MSLASAASAVIEMYIGVLYVAVPVLVMFCFVDFVKDLANVPGRIAADWRQTKARWTRKTP